MNTQPDWSPSSLWEDFDPRAEDLQVQILQSSELDGVRLQELTYFSHNWEGEPVKAYAYLAIPSGRSGLRPGILHIHGGGQTAFADHVVDWAKRGFAALSFDWTGPTPGRQRTTTFGLASLDKYLVEPDPRYSHLFHGTLLARRGLTLLERQPAVDGTHMGIYGISWGGFLCWLVNGSDPRVRAAVPIYGCGGTLKQGNRTGPDFDPDNEKHRTWNFYYNPFVYNELQNGRVLFLDCTNDFFGWMDTAEELFTILPAQHSLCLCPHHDHHLDDSTSRNLYQWMQTHLCGSNDWPHLPKVNLKLSTQLEVYVTPDTPQDLESLEVYYASNLPPPPCRFWCPVPVRKSRRTWKALLPIFNPEIPHSVYATVHYRSGISLSSIPRTFLPLDFGNYEETVTVSSVVDDFSEGIGYWFLPGLGTEPFPENLKLKTASGPQGGPALTIVPCRSSGDRFSWNLATHRIADPRWRACGRTCLSLQIKVACVGPLQVRLTQRAGLSDARAYMAKVETTGERWTELELEVAKFTGPDSDPLESFDGSVLLEIFGTSPVSSPPLLGRVQWV